MKSRMGLVLVPFLLFISAELLAQETESGQGQQEPRVTGVHWEKGQAQKAGRNGSPL